MVEKENRPLNQSGDLNWVQKRTKKFSHYCRNCCLSAHRQPWITSNWHWKLPVFARLDIALTALSARCHSERFKWKIGKVDHSWKRPQQSLRMCSFVDKCFVRLAPWCDWKTAFLQAGRDLWIVATIKQTSRHAPSDTEGVWSVFTNTEVTF